MPERGEPNGSYDAGYGLVAGLRAVANLILDIGTHKTGSTSRQAFFRDELTVDEYPMGLVEPNLHLELQLLTMRPERLAVGAPTVLPDVWTSEAWQKRAREQVRRAIESSTERVVFSAEDLSFLRFDDELERLARLLEGRSTEVVVTFREASSFLEAYWDTMRLVGWQRSTDPDSIAYVEPDSWLVDYDAKVTLWKRHFGVVTDYRYEDLVARDASIIPAFARLLGLPPPRREYRRLTRDALKREALKARLADLRQPADD